MNKLSLVNVLHWVLVGSGVLISVATAVMGSPDVKLAGYAATVLSVAQVIHKFADAQQSKATVATAVAATVPIAQAAAVGNAQQSVAVEKAIQAGPSGTAGVTL